MAESPIPFDIDEYLRRTAGGAHPASSAAETRVPFFRRPLPGSAAVSRFGARAAGLARSAVSLPAAGIGAALTFGPELLKSAFEGTANLIAGEPNVRFTPERAARIEASRRTRAPAGRGAVAAPPKAAPLTDDQRAASLEAGRLQLAREALVATASPEAGGTGVSLSGAREQGGPSISRFLSSALRMKQITGDNARRLAGAKLAAQVPVAEKAAAETDLARIRQSQALRALTGGAAADEVAAIAAGRPLPGAKFQGIPDPIGRHVDVLQTAGRGAGAVRRVTPTQEGITNANIRATMKELKMSRAQAIEAYRKQGYDVSELE